LFSLCAPIRTAFLYSRVERGDRGKSVAAKSATGWNTRSIGPRSPDQTAASGV